MHPFDEHAAALATCFACPKLCRFACPVAEAEGRESSTPWGLMTRTEHVRQGRVPLDAETARLWEHCTACGRCGANCRHHVDVPEMLFAARAEAARAGLSSATLRAWAEDAPAENTAVRSLPEGGDVLLLPGHADAESITAARRLLSAVGLDRLGRPVRGLLTSGGRWRAAGEPERWAVEHLRAERALEGVRLLVCLEPADAAALRPIAPDAVRTLPEALWSRRTSLLPRLRRIHPGPVLYLDDCQLGRGLGVYDEPRALLAPVVGRVEEATMNRSQGGCCGVGAGFARTHPVEAAAVARESAADVTDVTIVMASPVCAAHLRASLRGRPVEDWAVLLSRAL